MLSLWKEATNNQSLRSVGLNQLNLNNDKCHYCLHKRFLQGFSAEAFLRLRIW